ncbi:hypothetical protein FKP32DRAFT_1631332 [Trametes sanguinea]|nr:hypothetical protein FKP32DRAFT_1631332 [Trametes sanguinea]
MLSCRPHRTLLSRSRQACRTSSSRYYSDKVRAFPFVVSREQAISELSLRTAGYTAQKSLSTLLRYLFPSLNVDALRPVRAVPVYLPTWVVDAEFEATAWVKKAESDDHYIKDHIQVQFAQSDMPGFLYSPLSSLSFMTPTALDVDSTPAVPWSESLRRHDGHDVLCLPYSLTPLHLVDAARSLSMADANITNTFRFEPASVKHTMLAAYPVLIPGYIAQYNVELPDPATRQRRETIVSAFIEAHVPHGRSAIEVTPIAKELFKLFNVPPPDLFINGQYAPLARAFACVYKVTGRHINSQVARVQVEEWVDSALAQEIPLQRYRERFFGTTEAEAIRKVESHWADARIRPFDAAERDANLAWLGCGSDAFMLKSSLEVYRESHDAPKGEQQADTTIQGTNDAELEWIKRQAEIAEQKRKELMPGWLAEYELQQRLLATPEPSTSSNDESAKQPDNTSQDSTSDATTPTGKPSS